MTAHGAVRLSKGQYRIHGNLRIRWSDSKPPLCKGRWRVSAGGVETLHFEPSYRLKSNRKTPSYNPSVTLFRPSRSARWVRSANLRFALASRLRRPQGDSSPGRYRSPLWLKICHRHISLTRRALHRGASIIQTIISGGQRP